MQCLTIHAVQKYEILIIHLEQIHFVLTVRAQWRDPVLSSHMEWRYLCFTRLMHSRHPVLTSCLEQTALFLTTYLEQSYIIFISRMDQIDPVLIRPATGFGARRTQLSLLSNSECTVEPNWVASLVQSDRNMHAPGKAIGIYRERQSGLFMRSRRIWA